MNMAEWVQAVYNRNPVAIAMLVGGCFRNGSGNPAQQDEDAEEMLVLVELMHSEDRAVCVGAHTVVGARMPGEWRDMDALDSLVVDDLTERTRTLGAIAVESVGRMSEKEREDAIASIPLGFGKIDA